jgi:DNA primase
VTGDHERQVPKPTRTATFNKSTILYRPTHHSLAGRRERRHRRGRLDALAIAAAAARRGEMDRFAPGTTSGVTASTSRYAGCSPSTRGPRSSPWTGTKAGVAGQAVGSRAFAWMASGRPW